MLGKFFNTFFPMREFLNYLFKKTLGDYILNDLDLNKIEIEISNKAFISLKNIDLNASEINKKHLENFPFLMLEGQIKKFDLSFSFDKISINIDKLNVLLMPIFNKEKSKNLVSKKQIPIKINESVNMNDYNNETSNINSGKGKDYSSTQSKENNSNEFSLVSSFLNSALHNLEINITNISLSILSFEGSNTFQDNPILTFFISEVCFRKKNDEDINLIKENKNFQKLEIKNKKATRNINLNNGNACVINNNIKTDKNLNIEEHNTNKNNFKENDTNFTNKDDLKTENTSQNQCSFLKNKILLVDKIILRIHQQDQKIENEFFEMTNENEEKLNFNFFCNNSSILAFDYKTTGYSILVNFEEILEINNKQNGNETYTNIMEINVDIRKLEICLNPLQLQILINYFDVFKIISLIKEKDFGDIKFKQENKTDNNDIKNNIKILKRLKILNSIISKFSLNIYFEGTNIIVLETNYMKDLPKLWSFFQENYNKKIENIYALESHFSYLEDNYFLVNFSKFKITVFQDFINNKENFEFTLEKIFIKYIEYLGKKKIIPDNNMTHRKLTFNNNNSILLGKNSSNNIVNENNPTNSKIFFNSQMHKSKNFNNNNFGDICKNFNNLTNNNNIYSSNIFYMDKSMNRSNCSIYESVRDYEEANNNDSFLIKNSTNNTIYQSTLDCKDALLERYNLIFESEYSHQSHVILELTNNSITDNLCFVVRGFTDYNLYKKYNMNVNLNLENNSQIESKIEVEEKNMNVCFAENSKIYLEILFKKLCCNFNPLYLFKITKLLYFSQIILNEFLYLLDNSNLNNNKSKIFKNNVNISKNNIRKESENLESFLDKSVYENEIQDNPSAKVCNNNNDRQQEIENNKILNESNLKASNDNINENKNNNNIIYYKGFYNKSTQILLHIEEINMKFHSLKKDFYDVNGKCKTNCNSNLNEEFKRYEEFSKLYSNSKFLSEYLIEYFKLNLSPFICDFAKNEYNKSIIGKKQEIKLDKQIHNYIHNQEFFELNLTNHRILINIKNEKNEIEYDLKNNKEDSINQNSQNTYEKAIGDSVFYLNSLNKIFYDFDIIQVNFGLYNILKLKRDMLGFQDSSSSIDNTNSYKIEKENLISHIDNNKNQRKIYEFENSLFEKSEKNRNSINNKKNKNDLEEKTSKNNLHFRLSPIVINQKRTVYPEDSKKEDLNFAYRKEFLKAEEKINSKIDSIYLNHNLNLYQNLTFSNSLSSIENKEEAPVFINKIIEKTDINIKIKEDIYFTIEPQYINRIIPFFDSFLFAINLHKILAKKQIEIYNFYKEIYFVSLNIDNFKDFNFYFKNKKNNEEGIPTEYQIKENFAKENENYNSNEKFESEIEINKFNNINIDFDNIVLVILKNNTEDYLDFTFKQKDYTNYLVKLKIVNPIINLIIKGNNNLNILISINDIVISSLKNNNKKDFYFFEDIDNNLNRNSNRINFENENENTNEIILKDISYNENLFLFKGDNLYQNINYNNNNKFNQNSDPEKNLEKYFKNQNDNSKHILTLVIKFKENPKQKLLNKIKMESSIKNHHKFDLSKDNLNFNIENAKNKKENILNNFDETEYTDLKVKNDISKNVKNDNIYCFDEENILIEFEKIIENNLIQQTDTNLDIIIISNDAVISPLTYSNFSFEEIKIIAKEFGCEKPEQNSLNSSNKDTPEKILDLKLNDLNEFTKTTRSELPSICIKDFQDTKNNINYFNELKLDFKESSSKFEINMQNNLENIIRQENLILDSEKDLSNLNAFKESDINNIKKIKKDFNDSNDSQKIKIEKNTPLINLFGKSNTNIDFNIEVNKLSIDIFIQEDDGENNHKNDDNKIKSQSIYNIENKIITQKYNRKRKIRGILHIEKITHFKEIDIFSKINRNLTKRNLTIENLSLFLLKNLDHPYAEMNILKLNNGRYFENSIFKFLGFVEILNINLINLSFSKEIRFDSLKNENLDSEKIKKGNLLIPNINNDIKIKIGDVSIYLCKDTLDTCIEITESFKEKFNKIKDLIPSEENKENDNNLLNNSNDNLKSDNELNKQIKLTENLVLSKEEEIRSRKGNSFDIIKNNRSSINTEIIEILEENYFEKNNLKNIVLVDDYCFHDPFAKPKDLESEFEKLGYSTNIENKPTDEKNYFNENLNNLNSLNLDNKERKEETIILFNLDSMKIYIYKGNDFDFIEEDYSKENRSFHEKIDSKNTSNEKINNDEIFMVLTNSLNLNHEDILNKKELKKTFDFFYDNQCNSIKINENFINNNSLNLKCSKFYRNKNYDNNLSEKNNTNNNCKLINNSIESYYSCNNKIVKSIDNKSIFDKENFQIIEKFYFCEDKKQALQHKEQINKFNYLSFEKKLLRKKLNIRDYNNHICINLEILRTKFSFFKNNEKITMNIFLDKFDIDDYVKNSKYKKMISKYVLENFDKTDIYENSKNSKKINKYKNQEDKPLLDFDIEIVKINECFKFNPIKTYGYDSSDIENRKIRKNSDFKIEENILISINKENNVDNIDILDLKNKNKKLENDLIYIDGFISPLNILVDQATLLFIIEFFLAKENKSEINRKKDNIKETQKRNINFKKIKDPLDLKINVEKLKSVNKSSDDKPIKNPFQNSNEEKINHPNRNEYNSTNSTYSFTDSNFGVETFSISKDEKYGDDNNNVKDKKSFLKNAKISEFFILFSYNAHSISLSKLTNKEYLELLNFSNISDLKIDFKRYDFNGYLPIEEFPKNILNVWIKDLMKEKTKILSNVINSVGFIKPFTTMMSGFYNVLILPYKNYIQDRSLTNGLFGEFKNFVLKLTSQSLFLSEKTFLVIKKIISGGENTNLDKKSYYKKFLYMIDNDKKKYEEYYYK